MNQRINDGIAFLRSGGDFQTAADLAGVSVAKMIELFQKSKAH